MRAFTRRKGQRSGLARILLVDDNPTSRLTLQTILHAGGYDVDAAASAAEAVEKLDEGEYELVLSDLGMESPEAGYRVLSHARTREYKPATALVTMQQSTQLSESAMRRGLPVLIETEEVPELLTRVAELISLRASRKVSRELRMAAGAVTAP
jgi:CheY-like chemotaxis protein